MSTATELKMIIKTEEIKSIDKQNKFLKKVIKKLEKYNKTLKGEYE